MFIIHFECHFDDVSIALFSEVHWKPGAVKSLSCHFPTCKEAMTEIVIVKVCSHGNCIPGRYCVLLRVFAGPLSRQKMAELLSCVTSFLPILSRVNLLHHFLSHSLYFHHSVNTFFLLK